MSHRTVRTLLLLACAFAAVLAVPASGLARSHGDRNRDRIPDRWERAHHLSLHVNQARRDQDHDGLNNRGEFRAHLNPRDDDTDNDGIEDGDENAGTITSFTGGVLTVALAGGGSLSANVTGDTQGECDDTAPASDDGDGDHHGGGDDDDDDHEGDDNCGAEALTAGRTVKEAE